MRFYRRYASSAFVQANCVRIFNKVNFKLFFGKSFQGGLIFDKVGSEFSSKPDLASKVMEGNVEGLVQFGKQDLCLLTVSMNPEKNFDLVLLWKLLYINAHFLRVPKRVIRQLNKLKYTLNHVEA